MFASGATIYAYVGGNPVSRIDPTGQFAQILPVIGIVTPIIVCAVTHCINQPPYRSEPIEKPEPNSDKAEKARERKEYSRICKTPIEETGDPCTDARANLNRLKQCLKLREEFGLKWYNDLEPGHETKNKELRTAIFNLDKWLDDNCKEQCD